MTTSYAFVPTPHAGDYLIELGRTWHRSETVLAEAPTHIEIPFPIGRCAIDVEGDVLNIRLDARSNYETTLLEDLISDQLDRLSADEDLRYQWVRTPDELKNVARATRAFRFG